jgi:hypothetical protein
MFNQGNLLLASAHHVEQPGEWTWIMCGCERDDQKEALGKLAHPSAKVWHMPEADLLLVDPTTGDPYPGFQASNRPVAVQAWWKATQPPQEAIGIIDPDMFWLRKVSFIARPTNVLLEGAKSGPWETYAAKPKQGTAARYGIGCVIRLFGEDKINEICGDEAFDTCMETKKDDKSFEACSNGYSSGPPWMLHHSDAEDVLGSWMDTAILVSKAWDRNMLSEQGAYGISQMKHGVKDRLDAFWFLSAPSDPGQPWNSVAKADWDPCHTREPPPTGINIPPLFHACSTFEPPALLDQGFRIHKDHIHKDLLDCQAPLIHYPPQDALNMYKTTSLFEGTASKQMQEDFRETWSVCAYTNLINAFATSYKTKFCEAPNLNATFAYPGHAQSFLNPDSWLQKVFRKGGWTDIDYKVSS